MPSAVLGVLGVSWVLLILLVAWGSWLGRPKGLWDLLGRLLGSCRGPFGPSWRPSGGLLGAFGASWVASGAFWEHGRSDAGTEAMLKPKRMIVMSLPRRRDEHEGLDAQRSIEVGTMGRG